MQDNNSKLHHIPSIDFIKNKVDDGTIKPEVLSQIIRNNVDAFRQKMMKDEIAENQDYESMILNNITSTINTLKTGSIHKVINGTGIILHTGLGRAPFSDQFFIENIQKLVGYQNLELNLDTGKRGERLAHLRRYFQLLSGAEDAIVVNNNAAALMLILNTLSDGKEVIISRGELIEIGGSFRLPDVITKSGAILHEIGTTNRTHLSDYRDAVCENTGAILLAHTSNYTIEGFTKTPGKSELIALAKENNIPIIYDLGSGEFTSSNEQYDIQKILRYHFDLVCFSGDKLLGGPQSGIILGKKLILEQLHKNPFYRALRCDKFTIIALEWILRKIITNKTDDIAQKKLMRSSIIDLEETAESIVRNLPDEIVQEFGIEILKTFVEAGSGSLPNEAIESFGLIFKNINAERISENFRKLEIPILGYIKNDCFIIDMKAINEQDIGLIISNIQIVFNQLIK